MAYVRQASERLSRVQPTVVAVTGSYGKTSAKNHIAHLVAGERSVVASPASFNNRAGLARAVNEQLVDGTEVFVAEMGTYGPGEIAELCRWFPPRVAVITAVGPVHLERFGSEDAIARAKAEIAERASTVVLNVDDRRLATLADRLAREPSPRTVMRCSATDRSADVCVERKEGRVTVHANNDLVADGVAVPAGVHPRNLACAVAVALSLKVSPMVVSSRLADLPPVPNRLTTGRAPSGIVVLDDTYNANPAGARAALAALTEVDADGRKVVVTPGMVELGALQDQENEAFGAAVASVATNFVVVGRTNRRALVRGAHTLRPVELRTREEAVRWVRTHLGTGDAVLYENDLPDHYP
jgi:UDP-N-acetylmuramoyl-tripeptide--D-alanyl-D-alanine ligase